MKTIYVGNLPSDSSEQEIRRAFSRHGRVHKIKLIVDRMTGRPRGFGFIEMDDAAADAAVAALDQALFEGHVLRVDQTIEKLSAGNA